MAESEAGKPLVARQIAPSPQIRGTVLLPGDKSLSHRALLLGALCPGGLRVEGLLEAEDTRSTVEALRRFGVRIDDLGEGVVWVEGPAGSWSEPDAPLDCGNSGTTMRLLAGWMAGQGLGGLLTGDWSLSRRPMARICDPLLAMGAEIEALGNDDRPPIRLQTTSAGLSGIQHRSPVASAQVKSALLLAGLGASGRLCIIESLPTRDHTERLLAWFGIDLKAGGELIEMKGGQTLSPAPGTLSIPRDISSAAFFLVAAAIAQDGDVILPEVGLNPGRTGILDLFARLGLPLDISRKESAGPEPAGDLRIRSGSIPPFCLEGPLIPRLIDEIPILGVLASRAAGKCVIRDAHDLRNKESDRIASTASMLRAFGLRVEEHHDGLEIWGQGSQVPLQGGADIDCEGDHRIAMAAAVAATVAKGPTRLLGTGPVATSFPGFFDRLEGCCA